MHGSNLAENFQTKYESNFSFDPSFLGITPFLELSISPNLGAMMEPRCSLARCPPRACPPLALSGGRVLETASGKEGARALHTEGAERAAEATEGPGKTIVEREFWLRSSADAQPQMVKMFAFTR